MTRRRRILHERVRRVWPLAYLLVFGFVWLLGLAEGTVVEVARATEFNDLDHRVWRWVIQKRENDPRVTSVFLAITKVGDAPGASVLIAASVLGLVGLGWKGKRPLGRWGPWFFLWVMVGSQILTWLVKAHFQRVRPDALFRLVVEDSYSFPSGHSLTSACFCGLWTWAAWRLLPQGRRWLGVVVLPWIVLPAFLVAASRVWLGVHYFNDVAGGLFLGFAWSGLSVGVHEWLQATPGPSSNPILI